MKVVWWRGGEGSFEKANRCFNRFFNYVHQIIYDVKYGNILPDIDVAVHPI